MNINIKLIKNFTTQYNKLQEQYGTDIARINGFDDNQLSYTNFIDNFIDETNVSDSSIDGNSNVSHKDIVSLLSEMPKPHEKLLAFNKIYYELQKKYGFQVANNWLEAEWVGKLYMHDANTSTFKHYCFKGDTKILTKEGIKELKELDGKQIMILNKNHGWEDATVKHFGRAVLRKLILERYGVNKELYVTGNHLWFVKNNKGITEIATDNLKVGMEIPFNTSKVWSQVNPSPFGVAHGFFIGDGFKGEHMRANFCGDKIALLPYFTPAKINGTKEELTTIGIPNNYKKLPSLDESASYLYGWLSGYFAADGNVDEKGRCTISSTKKENLEFVRNVLCVLGMPVNEIRYQDRISNLTNEMGRVYVLTLTSEYLKEDFFIRPFHKENFAMSTEKNDRRKNRSWIVKSVEDTGVEDDVYCAVVNGTQSFTLDNNILTHNCFAYDLKDLAEKGLYFLGNNFNAEPAKHLTTFIDFVKEFIGYSSNRSSGAVGLPNLIPYMYYFYKQDIDKDYMGIKTSHQEKKYAEQEFQRFIYAVNQPYVRDGQQSAFTNTTVFDHPYFEALFGSAVFPDGSFMIDSEEEIIEFQKIYMKVMAQIRHKNMFTFPVSTISLLRQNGEFIDKEFATWGIKHNMEWSDSNIFVDSSVNSLSNCCFSGSQMTLTKSSDGVNLMSFEQLYDANYKNTKRNLTIFHNGNWIKGKIIKLPNKKLYKVITTNNKELIMTDNHISLTFNGDKTTKNLTTEDYIAFNTKAVPAVHEDDKNLTYEQGFLIGMYLGDGCMSNEYTKNTPTIELSLNQEKYENSINILNKAIKNIDSDASITLGSQYNNVYPIKIRNTKIHDFIREYVLGKYCYEKSLNMNCILQSENFRKGIIDGYYLTDGGNSNRIYSTSEILIKDMECLFTSLGVQTIIDISDRTGKDKVVIRGKEFNRNYPVYCIRWYESYKRVQKGVYKWFNNSIYFKIKSIEPYDSTKDVCYCFEMDNEDEPYFTLPNGVITHNCRLKSNIKDLGYFNSVGGTALKVGSVKVNTINLARLALDTNTEDEYLIELQKRVILGLQALDVVRHILQRNVEKGLLPNFSYGLVDFEHLYNTIGFIGIYETMKKFGYIKLDEFGNTFYTEDASKFGKKIFDVIHNTADKFIKDNNCNYMINTEQIPAESAAAKLMKKDKFFYPKANIYDLPLYGNQFIPLGIQTTGQERVRIQALFDGFCNGGSILHYNIDAPFDSFNKAWKMINYIADQGVTYFAFNTKIQVCKHNHAFYGSICPICGEPVDTEYSRIVGFYTATKVWSKERKAEYKMRKWDNKK